MNQEQLFRSKLASIGTFLEEKENIVTEEEIRNYFDGITLTDEQWEMVFGYLGTLKVHIVGRKDTARILVMPEGVANETAESASEEPSEDDTSKEPSEDEQVTGYADESFQIFLDTLQAIAPAKPGEEDDLLKKACDGDYFNMNRLTELYLFNVLAIAKDYAKGKIPINDLVQEGNMGLLTGISMLETKPSDISAEDYLVESIRESIELFVLDQSDQTDLGLKVADKVNKLNAAIKELEEDLGHQITAAELSAFTNLPLEEIEETKRLAGDELQL